MLDYNLLEDISSKGGGKSSVWVLWLKCQFWLYVDHES
jgi:hypothetical protein